MTIDWLALLQVSLTTIIVAVSVCGLMALANWLLVPAGEATVVPLARRVAGYALIGLMGVIVAAGLYLIVHKHVERLLGFLV